MAVSPPTGFILTKSLRSFDLSWNASATAGARYTVYRDRSGNGYFETISIAKTARTYKDFNINPGVLYRYHVIATFGGIESDPTPILNVTYVGPKDQYGARDAAIPATTVAAGVVKAGCGEFERLQKLRGRSIAYGK